MDATAFNWIVAVAGLGVIEILGFLDFRATAHKANGLNLLLCDPTRSHADVSVQRTLGSEHYRS